jgi:hypothetical protein
VVDLNPIGFKRTQIVANSNGKQLGLGYWWDNSKHILLWSGSALDFIYLDAFFPGGALNSITVTDIPQVRGDVEFYPSSLEKGCRSERALMVAITVQQVKPFVQYHFIQ